MNMNSLKKTHVMFICLSSAQGQINVLPPQIKKLRKHLFNILTKLMHHKLRKLSALAEKSAEKGTRRQNSSDGSMRPESAH